MNQEYIIPANSKKSALIAGFMRPIDLGILLVGCFITLGLLFTISSNSLGTAFLKISPALFCALLVAPIPNYHNTLVFIRELFMFFTERRVYLWKGWCIKDDTEK